MFESNDSTSYLMRLIFEGSIDFDIPQSCAFHSMTVELKQRWRLKVVVGGQFVLPFVFDQCFFFFKLLV